jgi:protein-S-isoprenylcysteine O-methyltransferase Ste14
VDSGTRKQKDPNDRPTLTLQIGKFKLTGWRAGLVLGGVVGAAVSAFLARRPDLHHNLANDWPMLLSAGLWLLFSLYWSAAARNSAAAKSSESRRSTLLHQLLLNVALLLLFIPVPGLNYRFLPGGRFLALFGLAVQAAFVLLAVWARGHLGRNWSAEVRVATGHELVRTGPYRLLRHPIYSAMFGMSIGTAIVFGKLHALVGVGLLTIAYRRKIRLEEERMTEEFGAAYEEYRRRSWALIPWVL